MVISEDGEKLFTIKSYNAHRWNGLCAIIQP